MATDIRRRTVPSNNTLEQNTPSTTMSSSTQHSPSLTAPKLQQASPQHQGTVLKLHVPTLYTWLPPRMQRILTWLGCGVPQWRVRYLILVGSFLYKFANATDPHRGPKGRHWRIESIDAVVMTEAHWHQDNLSLALQTLPPEYTTVVRVSTLDHTQYFACHSREDAQVWIQSIQEARPEAIRRRLGHAAADAVPPLWRHYDRLGQALVRHKERVQRRTAQHELEWSQQMARDGSGGTVPMGYFG
jgi:hypothetical protein